MSETQEGDASSSNQTALVVAIAGLSVSVAGMAWALDSFTPDALWLPVTGAVAGIVVVAVLRPALRGFPNARELTVVSALALSAFFVAALVALNGALDTSPPERRFGHVERVSREDDEGEKKTQADIRWDDGHTTDGTFRDPHEEIQEGDAAILVLRGGRFGARWVETVTVHTPDDRKPPK
jgi:hypothetical protein